MNDISHLYQLPDNLPHPVDDGACDHLPGQLLPSLALPSTSGGVVNPARIDSEWVVMYCYPLTGVPGVALPNGWDLVPGARGCTPQTCTFRDLYEEFSRLGVRVFGVSTQTTEYQRELIKRLNVPFEILSDHELQFARVLNLPTFTAANQVLLKRLTLVVRSGKIEKVFYPIFPPTKNAGDVLNWIREHSG